MRTQETDAAEDLFADQFPNITAAEMRCRCGICTLPITEPEFVDFVGELQELRNVAAFPFHFTSFYRCPSYNDLLYGGNGTHLAGPHTKGAADISVSFERAYRLAKIAFMRDFGVGLKQHGDVSQRFIHVDNQGTRQWTYT